MNCDQFESTLNVLLDLRENPASHAGLLEHATDCDYCSDSLDFYSAMGDYSERSVPNSLQARLRFTRYVATVTAASLLLFLLSPLGSFSGRDPEKVDIAHASGTAPIEINSKDRVPSPESESLNPEFWQNRRFDRMMPLNEFAFEVPQPPNFEEVGQSINSVWKSIQEDNFLLPIIRQGALFWIPK